MNKPAPRPRPRPRAPRPSTAERLELRFQSLSPHLGRIDRGNLPHLILDLESRVALLRRRLRDLELKSRQQAKITADLDRVDRERDWRADDPYSQKMRRREIRRARDIEIMRLAARGWPNDRIARKLALSPSQVSRIVQRLLKETRALPGEKAFGWKPPPSNP